MSIFTRYVNVLIYRKDTRKLNVGITIPGNVSMCFFNSERNVEPIGFIEVHDFFFPRPFFPVPFVYPLWVVTETISFRDIRFDPPIS